MAAIETNNAARKPARALKKSGGSVTKSVLSPIERLSPSTDPSPAEEATGSMSREQNLPRPQEPSSRAQGHVERATHCHCAEARETSSSGSDIQRSESHCGNAAPDEPSSPCSANHSDVATPTTREGAAGEPSSSLLGQDGDATHSRDARRDEPSSAGGQATVFVPPMDGLPCSPAELILAIRGNYRARMDFVRMQGDAERRIKAMCRRDVGFSTFAPADERKEKLKEATALLEKVEAGLCDGDDFITLAASAELRRSRDQCAERRQEIEKRLTKLAKQLHVASFVEATSGFGYGSLAAIVGEAGDLSQYANPAKLWKRMGLGLMPDGRRQQRFADKLDALQAGYSPRRRSTMFVIGDSLIKKQGVYREIYLKRKAYEVEKAEAAGLKVVPAASIPKAQAEHYRSEGHIHSRAQRYTEKRLLRDLWRAWNGATAVAA